MCAPSHPFCVVPEYVFCISDVDGGAGICTAGADLSCTLGDAACITLGGGAGGEGSDVVRSGDTDGGIVGKMKEGDFD